MGSELEQRISNERLKEIVQGMEEGGIPISLTVRETEKMARECLAAARELLMARELLKEIESNGDDPCTTVCPCCGKDFNWEIRKQEHSNVCRLAKLIGAA